MLRLRESFLLAALLLALAGCAEDVEYPDEVESGAVEPEIGREEMEVEDGAYATEGLVTAVDPSAEYLVIDHEPVPDLGWPRMTMQFKVAEPGLLDDVQVNDRVRFTFVEAPGGIYLIESLEEE